MAAIIGALRAELSASIAQWQSDMGKAAVSLKGFTKTAKGISKELDDVGKKMSLAITAPLTLLAKAGLDEAKQAREAMGQVEAALLSTGGASGKTATELQKSAKALQNLSTFDDDDILRNVTTNLLTFGNVQGQVFDRAQKSVVDLASRLGGDLQGATIKIGRALQDPIQGVQSLTRLGITFTDQQKAQLKQLVQNGEGYKAQGMILDELEKKFGGAAAAARAAAPDAQLTQLWRDFKETIGAIELQLLPAFTEKLKALASWFQNLTPETQKWVVQLGLAVAVLGPALILVGKLVSVVGTLVPLIKGVYMAVGLSIGAFTAWAVVITAVVVGLAYLLTRTSQVTTAIEAQATAHKELNDLLDTAKKSGDALSETDAAAAKKKLELAAATLKAARAQAEQNLAMAKSLETAPDDLGAGNAYGYFQEDKAQKDLARIDAALKQNTQDAKNLGKAVATAAALPKGAGTLNFNLDNTAELKKTADAAKTLKGNLEDMGRTLSKGLDAINLPKSTAQANALNAQLDAYVKTAQEAGVKTAGFAGEVAALRSRIADLQKAGLAKEATDFERAVDKTGTAVKRFAAGGLDPLSDKLDTIDTAFETLRGEIEKQITDNAVLASSNDVAAKAMARLQVQLESLDDAHQKAADAARAQYQAEEKLADLSTRANNLDRSNALRDLTAARTGGGPVSTAQKQLQDASDALARKQIDVSADLVKLEEQREQAALEGHQSEVDRLDTEIALQKRLSDLVSSTTADQLDSARKLDEAFTSFTDDLTSQLTDAVANWSFDLEGITGIFRQLLKEMLLKPVISAGVDFLGGALKGAFAGIFDDGGTIGPGEWGIKSGMPEIIQGGTHGVSVMPLDQMDGGGRDIYIDARGADTAAVARLANVVGELQRREGGRVKGYQADNNARSRA